MLISFWWLRHLPAVDDTPVSHGLDILINRLICQYKLLIFQWYPQLRQSLYNRGACRGVLPDLRQVYGLSGLLKGWSGQQFNLY